MFCLFRNSRFIYPLNYIVFVLSIAPVFYWLYFALVEKSFLDNFIKGQTLFVDLLLGLPVVLLFAVIIYAMIYWTLKVITILVAPFLLEENKLDLEEDTFDPASMEEHGKDYWLKEQEEQEVKQEKQQANQQKEMDNPVNKNKLDKDSHQ
jgi:hypothetical protein